MTIEIYPKEVKTKDVAKLFHKVENRTKKEEQKRVLQFVFANVCNTCKFLLEKYIARGELEEEVLK